MSNSPKPKVPGFICYSRKDTNDKETGLFDGLRRELRALEHSHGIEFWKDTEQLRAGDKWYPEIERAIEAARLFVLPVSKNWVASDFILTEELPRIVARHNADPANVVVCPVILEKCNWLPHVGALQLVPHKDKQFLPIWDRRPRKDGYDQARVELAQMLVDRLGISHSAVAWKSVASTAQQEIALFRWIRGGKHLRIDPEPTKPDLDTANDPSVRDLRDRVQDLARELGEALRGLGASPNRPNQEPVSRANDEWADLYKRVLEFDEYLQKDLPDIAAKPTLLWSHYIDLRAFRDDLAAAGPDALPAAMRRRAQQLIERAAILVHQFPSIQGVVDGMAGAENRQPADFQGDAIHAQATLLLQRALGASAIDEASFSTANDLLSRNERMAALTPSDRRTLMVGIRNLLVKAAGIVSANMLAGLDFGPNNDEMALHAAIKTMLAELDLPDLLQSFGDPVLQQALSALIGEAGKPLGAFEVSDNGDEPDPDDSMVARTGQRFPLPEMVSLPGGAFMMGTPVAESERENVGWDNDRPVHRVTVPAFQMGKYPVTVGQYRLFVEDSGYTEGGDAWKPADLSNEDHPVVNVSWDDAKAYIDWLNKCSSGGFGLPSEAQWEFACRAGTETSRWWGDEWDGSKANANGYHGGTTDVKTFDPNPWGLHDMFGNVWEWCEDPWHDDYKDNPPTDGGVWEKGGDPGRRVVRGGSCNSVPRGARAGSRVNDARENRDGDVGFRLVRTN